jgi:hypothetical protein
MWLKMEQKPYQKSPRDLLTARIAAASNPPNASVHQVQPIMLSPDYQEFANPPGARPP